MGKQQIKFYVTENEKKRLEVLAKLRFMTVPNYVKVTALGVQIRQVQEVYVEQYAIPEERIYVENEPALKQEDKALLQELLQRSTKKGYIQYDADFNERLQELAKRLINKS